MMIVIVLALVALDLTILCAKDELSRIADALEERNKQNFITDSLEGKRR